jgi:SfnB family sulfur acquisition oxidoreductase
MSHPLHPLTERGAVIAAAMAFADVIRVDAVARDRAGAVPVAELAEYDRIGFPALTIPAGDGGAGHGPSAVAEVTRIIAAADPSIAQVPQSHFLAVDVLMRIGTATQRAQAFPVVTGGGRIQPVLAERGGQHAQQLRTRLSRRRAGLVLDGVKYYSTGASTAAWLAVSALDDADRLVLALVERRAPGVRIDDDWSAMGQRATVSGTTRLEGVVVNPALVLPYQDAYATPQVLGARAQLTHTAIEVGIAEGALEDARAFVAERSRPAFEAVRSGWASTAAKDPHTIYRFGRLSTRVTAARELLRWAAAILDEIGLVPDDADTAARGSIAVAQAKAFASEVAVEVASELFALTGTSGTGLEFGLDRHWRNARTHSVHDPVDWKYHHIGAYGLSGTLPPSHGQL